MAYGWDVIAEGFDGRPGMKGKRTAANQRHSYSGRLPCDGDLAMSLMDGAVVSCRGRP